MTSAIHRATSTLILLCAATTSLAAQSIDSLRTLLARRIAQDSVVVGLYFRDLVQNDTLTINPDLRFHAASTMKVPVMIQVYRDAEQPGAGLRERVRITNEFRSLADSSAYSLSPGDDSDSSLYRRVGQEMSIADLLELMITRSSNLATNLLIDRVGAARVQATMHELGADSVRVLRGVEDNAAFRAGMNNTTTARGLGIVMAAIANGTAASAQSCGEMLQILLRQKFNESIPAGLPPHTKVAHKTGWITGQHHDAAIVYAGGRPRYVLVILTRGIPEEARSAHLMADLATLIHTRLFPPPPPRPPSARRNLSRP